MAVGLGRTKWGSIVCCNADGCTMPDAKWHGTAGGYSNHLCKCAECTEAWRIKQSERGYSKRHRIEKISRGLLANSTLSVPKQRQTTIHDPELLARIAAVKESQGKAS